MSCNLFVRVDFSRINLHFTRFSNNIVLERIANIIALIFGRFNPFSGKDQ